MKRELSYNSARKLFLVLFLLSTALALVLTIFGAMIFRAAAPTGETNPDALTIGGLVAIVSSCITSMVTFVGFISTTLLTWRKEARENQERELELKRKEIEIEKEKFELEKMKAEQESRSSDQPK